MIGDALLDYHERTKHSVESVRRTGGFLDWDNVPDPLKRYTDVPPVPLPPFRATGVPCHAAIAASARSEGDRTPNVETLSHLLFHAAGVVRTVGGFDGPMHFRTYASAGALYPIEVYLVSGELEGLEAGVYHYAPAQHALARLRSGDFRGSLGLAGAEPGAATLLLSGIPWRTAWKYGPRGFRHLYWDAGMMLANLLAAASAQETRATVLLGFVDEPANAVAALDGRTEFVICAVALGRGEAPSPREAQPLQLKTSAISRHPRRDPVIEDAHDALVFRSDTEVGAFRSGSAGVGERTREMEGGEEEELVVALPAAALSTDGLEDVVRRRGSSRDQARDSFPAAEYAAILDRALTGTPSDFNQGSPTAFLIANALESLPAGVFRYARGGRFRPIRKGEFRRKAGFVCLEQRLASDAAVVVFLMADLEASLGSHGDRGYAAAQLGAAIAAGRIYLGAYAQCLGTSGITFYDDEARLLFDTPLEPMLAVVTGPEAGRRSIIRCREERTPASP
jgi:SagB-type dehydrogenase family enzyme